MNFSKTAYICDHARFCNNSRSEMTSILKELVIFENVAEIGWGWLL